MFSGFYGLNRAYVDDDRETSVILLAFYMSLTGVGSCAGDKGSFEFAHTRIQLCVKRRNEKFPCV
jgi:hypothetical protein